VIATSTPTDIASFPPPERGSDGLFRDRALQALRRSGYRVLWEVKCDVAGGVVSLSGVVPNFFLKQIAQTIILRMGSGKQLANNLQVQSTYCESGLYERI
jgi:osmotically-inducible protein OsmY